MEITFELDIISEICVEIRFHPELSEYLEQLIDLILM